MRNLNLLNCYRISGKELWGWDGDETCGAFSLPSPIDRGPLNVIASSGEGWDHVSVSRLGRCPNWPEMEYVKHLFFRDNEVAMQLHVPASDHINNHPFTLHMWRPQEQTIPLPPKEFV